MNDKVEWEIVDEAAQKAGPAPQPGPAAGSAAQAMLGPWWRWKLAALFALGAVALILLVAVAGVIAVTVAAAALVSVGIARVAYWLRGKHGGAVARRGYGPPYQ